MIAIDTNLIVRFLARDDLAQAAQVKALVETQTILLLKTVLLEAEWVLRTSYGFDRAAVGEGLRRLTGLPGVQVEDGANVARAFAWFDQASISPTRSTSRRAAGPTRSPPSIGRCAGRRSLTPCRSWRPETVASRPPGFHV